MEMHRFEKWFVNSNFCNFLQKKYFFHKFFDFIGKELEGNALEVGCGIGVTTELFSTRYKRLEIIAMDYDKEQIKLAKKDKKLKKARFMQGDATNIKFKDNSFDYVFESDVFHHIKNYSDAIKEVSRVLKKNGVFYMMDISKYCFIWPVRFFFPPESFFTKKEFIEKLTKNGFKVEKSAGNLIFLIQARKIRQ